MASVFAYLCFSVTSRRVLEKAARIRAGRRERARDREREGEREKRERERGVERERESARAVRELCTAPQSNGFFFIFFSSASCGKKKKHCGRYDAFIVIYLWCLFIEWAHRDAVNTSPCSSTGKGGIYRLNGRDDANGKPATGPQKSPFNWFGWWNVFLSVVEESSEHSTVCVSVLFVVAVRSISSEMMQLWWCLRHNGGWEENPEVKQTNKQTRAMTFLIFLSTCLSWGERQALFCYI